MIAPNQVGDADLASTSVPQRKPPKLRHKQAPQHGLDEAVEEEPNDDTLSAQKQVSVPNTSEHESNFEDGLEGESSASEPQPQPVPQRERRTRANKPFRDEEEERDMAHHEDALPDAGRQRRRRGRRGEQELIPSNTTDDVGRRVMQSGDLVRNRTETVVGTTADSSGRVQVRHSEGNEVVKKEKDEQLRLRLELNLDLEVELKAKISGDLTLSLLLVSASAHCELR